MIHVLMGTQVKNKNKRMHGCNVFHLLLFCTVNPVLSGHSKIDSLIGSLMKSKVLQNALLEHSAMFLNCIKQ